MDHVVALTNGVAYPKSRNMARSDKLCVYHFGLAWTPQGFLPVTSSSLICEKEVYYKYKPVFKRL
jgi:hypothetical protein